jgi:lysophospholipase L1-like esterase
MDKIIKKLLIIIVCTLLAVGLLFILRGSNESNSTEDAPTQTEFGFMSLGDSVASGVGLPTYIDSTACNRTEESYPQQLAKQLNATVTHAACSGASYYSGVLERQIVNKLEVAPQVSKLKQSEAPRFITLTAGANDTKWIEIITKCYVDTCGTAQDTLNIDNSLKTVARGLADTLEYIKQSNPGTHVFVTGYHQVMPANLEQQCRDLNGVNQTEQSWARDQQARLNKTLQETANNFDFAKFVGVDFTGHELCTDNPWVQGLSDSAPYHPTARGHQAFVAPLLEAINEN